MAQKMTKSPVKENTRQKAKAPNASKKQARITVPAEKTLDAKERQFVQYYLISLDPKDAALKAGYSESMAASKAYQWVSNGKVKPHVFAAVQKAMEKRAEKLEISADRVLQEYAKIAFSDIRKVARWGNTTIRTEIDDEGNEVERPYHGLAVIDSSLIDDHTAAAIAEV